MEDDTKSQLLSAIRYGSLENVEKLINALDRGSPEWSDNSYFFLQSALGKDRPKIVELLMANNCTVNRESDDFRIPLHLAVKSGNLEIIEKILDQRANVDAKDDKGKTALRIAVEERLNERYAFWPCNEAEDSELKRRLKLKMDVVEMLLKRGANPDLATNTGVTPLYFMVTNRNLDFEVIAMLMKYGASVNTKVCDSLSNEPVFTALHSVIQNGYPNKISKLLKYGADPNIGDAYGRTALHAACSNFWCHEVVQELLNHGADVNRVCTSGKYKGYTPLHFAAQSGNSNAATMLLARGAKVDISAKDGLTPLHLAVKSRYTRIVEVLIENGADVNVRTKNGTTTLQLSCKAESSSIVGAILKRHPDASCENNRLCIVRTIEALDRKKRLYSNSDKENVMIIDKLVEYDFPISDSHVGNTRLLRMAIENRCLGLVERLLKLGANANFKFEDGTTLIGIAVRQADARMAKLLLQNGAYVMDDPCLLCDAVRTWSSETVGVLPEYDVDLDAWDSDGAPALFWTTQLHRISHDKSAGSIFDAENEKIIDSNASSDIARLLINKGANVHACTKEGRTTLHEAASLGCVPLVRLLLEFNANTNLLDQDNKTPLHLAAAEGHTEVVRILLEEY